MGENDFKYCPEEINQTEELKVKLEEIKRTGSPYRKSMQYTKCVIDHLKRLQRPNRITMITTTRRDTYMRNRNAIGIRHALPPQINMDIKKVYRELIEAEFINTKLKPISKNQLLVAQDADIITYFKTVAQGFLSYYRCCDNILKVKSLAQYTLKYSLIKTLMNKHKLRSTKKVIERYGKNIETMYKGKTLSYLDDTLTSNIKKEYLIQHSTKEAIMKNLERTYYKLQNDDIYKNQCAVTNCDNTDIEIHHIRKLYRGTLTKDDVKQVIVKGKSRTLTGVQTIESALKRKQIPLCKQHHIE